jgi:hypothetical protein
LPARSSFAYSDTLPQIAALHHQSIVRLASACASALLRRTSSHLAKIGGKTCLTALAGRVLALTGVAKAAQFPAIRKANPVFQHQQFH